MQISSEIKSSRDIIDTTKWVEAAQPDKNRAVGRMKHIHMLRYE